MPLVDELFEAQLAIYLNLSVLLTHSETTSVYAKGWMLWWLTRVKEWTDRQWSEGRETKSQKQCATSIRLID
ncbi:unnamed protein product [Gongylonema pulchrum]|uniref:Uncharacterized protein n=1 Tax=Gongylonema pulchrum TaxID=637853 RepID=A0A183E3R1_9BILA|nr:unnamed protein product [Gongylonema pulchrum]